MYKRQRLGHQMEHVFLNLIKEHTTHTVIVHNKRIKKESRHIGEIDFILQPKDASHYIHVELTYKFYIIDPSISEPIHRLMGPNRSDMFFTKMEKIKHKQFPLLRTTEGLAILAANEIDPNILVHETCYKAQLFMPYQEENVSIRPLNQKCVVGYWIRFNVFRAICTRENRYYLPYKKEWVHIPHSKVTWMENYQALLEINLRMLKKNSPMLWVQKPNGEIDKLFVVWW